MTNRLPIPGSDDDTWGTILNDFLEVSLSATGTLNTGTVGTAQLVAPLQLPATSGHALTTQGGSTLDDGLGNITIHGTTSGLLDKGGQIFNVKAYGATGNGTTDDTAAIASAITAAQGAGGGVVYFPTGTFLISSTLSVGGGFPGGLEIAGSGWNSEIKLANGSNCYMFDFGSGGNPVYTPGLIMRDLYLECNGANQTTAGGGIYARGAVHCRFSHLYIDTPWEAGIRFFQDGTGVYGHHNVIDGECWFVNGKNSNGGQGWAIKFNQADENRVIGCTFQDNCNPLGQGHDAQIYDTGAGLQTIVGNAFLGGGSGASFVKSDSSPGRIMFVGNAFDTPNGGGYCVEVQGTLCSFTGNTFLGIANGAGSNTPAIHLGGATQTVVTGNTFYSPGSHAIAVLEDGGGDFNTFGANTFFGTWAAGPISYSGAHDQVFNDGSGNVSIYGKAKISNAGTLASGTGAPSINGTAGDIFFRTDTPSTSNQRIYVCTVTGTPGTWVGIV